mgnify:CR=1 FL=1
MGFLNTISRGWKLSKLSMRVVMKDPELMVYMVLCGVMSLGVLGAMVAPQLLAMSWAVDANGQFTGEYYAWTFLGYMLLSIFVTFWNCAIVANSNIRLQGGDPKFIDGVKIAASHLPKIFLWGIIAGTIGLLLKMLEGLTRTSDHPSMQILGFIVHLIGSLVWWFMTFFILPVLILEDKGIGESLNMSKEIFKKTWGENIASGLGIGLIAFLLAIPVIGITAVLIIALGPIGLVVGILLMALLLAWANAAEQVAVTALYRYAKDGKMPSLYRGMGMSVYNFDAKL